MASKVLLSILCVPFWERQNSSRQKDELFVFNMNREKNMKVPCPLRRPPPTPHPSL